MTPRQVIGHQLGDAIREAIPPALLPVFVAITRLGNPLFFLVVFVLDYWFRDHERGAHALGLAVGGMAVVTALKTLFDAPRPPPAVNAIPISGFSFPSGHATGATVGYGILAYDLKLGSKRSRFAVAGALVTLVSLSRVVLGVHYVRDVVAGMAVGVLFLAAAFWLTEHDPKPAFVLAVATGAAAFVISGASHDGAAVFGGAFGAALTWDRLGPVPPVESLRSRIVLLGGFLPILGGLAYAATVMELPPRVVFPLNALLLAAVLASPHAVDRLVGARRDSRRTANVDG
ncbi:MULTISPECIES: phosphatase PAP2 family protein [Halorussus]|uniref:phosphatase PAP2 family protein n=1 Tax=Halorussus TaxID=1070314 RepID=UPI00209F26DF|nr:phosphatase PAP2 family protein [Halorussus vallis]USZ76401.1 phosphatase PAP2 family protein [Halorussus vallis]